MKEEECLFLSRCFLKSLAVQRYNHVVTRSDQVDVPDS